MAWPRLPVRLEEDVVRFFFEGRNGISHSKAGQMIETWKGRFLHHRCRRFERWGYADELPVQPERFPFEAF